VEGADVAIGRSLLVVDAISDGRLVPALTTAPYCPTATIDQLAYLFDCTPRQI
jgi:hypothetical protein